MADTHVTSSANGVPVLIPQPTDTQISHNLKNPCLGLSDLSNPEVFCDKKYLYMLSIVSSASKHTSTPSS